MSTQGTTFEAELKQASKGLESSLQAPYKILQIAGSSRNSFLVGRKLQRQQKGPKGGQKSTAKKGAPTEIEQDQLRAALVFACAGLDAMMKHIIRECIPELARSESEIGCQIRNKLEEWARRRFNESSPTLDCRLLAKLLSCERGPFEAIVTLLVEDLTGDSLQSAEQLTKALAYLGFPEKDAITKDIAKLGVAFKMRNQVIHEMDINFGQKNRARRQRGLKDIETNSEQVLRCGLIILNGVNANLKAAKRDST